MMTMPKMSRDKGAGFELKIAKIFGEKFGMEIRRTPMSGGWAQGAEDVAGDLVCVKPGPDAFPYCVECKKQESWRMETLFTDQIAWFVNWWGQLLNSLPAGKTPLLVFSRNRTPVFVSFPKLMTEDLLGTNEPGVPYLSVYLEQFGYVVIVMGLDDFLDHLSNATAD